MVLDQLPDGARWRWRPAASHRCRCHACARSGDLIEILPDDLRLTPEEARSVLGLHGCEVGDDDLDDLLQVTEGWPTGIYLALLAGDGCPARELLARLRGDRREIAGYLTTEVLDRQPADVQEFLLRTSILDQLSAGLCHAVTGQVDAAGLLDRLARDSLFVTPLDDHDAWYRYHHLFAELLRAQLERRAPETVADLHRRAAAWYETHGDGERAVRHAVAGGDADAVAELAAATCDTFMQVGQNERARQLLDIFSDEQLGAHPALAISRGRWPTTCRTPGCSAGLASPRR